MAAGQERQEPEEITQEVQEDKTIDTQDLPEDLSVEGLERIRQLSGQLAELITEIYKPLKFPLFSDTIKEMQKPAREMLHTVNSFADGSIKDIGNFAHSEQWGELEKAAAHLSEALEKKRREWELIEPFLLEEIKKPEYDGKDIGQLEYMSMSINGDIIKGSLWDKALTAAAEAMEKQAGKVEKQLPSVTMIRTDSVEYPVDKINSNIWYDLFKEDTGGQLCFAVQKKGAKEKIPIVYSIDFDALDEGMKITKKLTQFDKRVYIAISALFNEGNKVISLTQIHRTMGNEKRPNKEQLEKINNSITKMTGARITLDNSKEVKAKYGYDKFIYDGSLLPLERGAAVVNGQLADAAIHIFREPPAMSFAKQRKQITTLDIKLLQSPLNKTESNLLIDDYLIERIARAKRGSGNAEKILYKTLYEKAGIKTAKQKQRTADKIKSYLEHYQKCGFITKYVIESDGIRAYF